MYIYYTMHTQTDLLRAELDNNYSYSHLSCSFSDFSVFFFYLFSEIAWRSKKADLFMLLREQDVSETADSYTSAFYPTL